MKKCSKYLPHVIRGIILLGIIGACSSKASTHDGNDTEMVADDTIAVNTIADDSIDVKEVVMLSEQDIHSKKDFIKAFYQRFVANDHNFSFVKANITPKAMQYLQDEYEKEYDCEDGDCLAVWLFAYEPGSDSGEFLSHRIEEINENDFRVVTKYELADYVALVTVIEDGGTYKIDHVKQESVDDEEVEASLD